MSKSTTNKIIEQLQAENKCLKAERDCYKSWYFQAVNALAVEKANLIEYIKDYYQDTRFAYDADRLCEELDEILKERDNNAYVS